MCEVGEVSCSHKITCVILAKSWANGYTIRTEVVHRGIPSRCISGLEIIVILAAVKGIVHGNTVVIEDEDIRKYDGAEVVVILLDYPKTKRKKSPIDWDSYVKPSERGKNVDEYMKGIRDNDRM